MEQSGESFFTMCNSIFVIWMNNFYGINKRALDRILMIQQLLGVKILEVLKHAFCLIEYPNEWSQTRFEQTG